MSNIESLTTGDPTGEGVFDTLMRSVRSHMDLEFEKNRLNGETYAQTYVSLTQSALQQAIQFMLNEPQSAAQVALLGAQKEQTETQTALISQQRANAVTEGQNLGKQGILLDKQALTSDAELLRINAQTAQIEQQTTNLGLEKANIGHQGQLLISQKAQVEAETVVTTKNATMVDQQITNLGSENANLVTQNGLLLKQITKLEADTGLVNAQITSSTKQDLLTAQQTANLVAQEFNIPKEGAILDKQALTLDEEILTAKKNRDQADAQIALYGAQTSKTASDESVNTSQIGKITTEVALLDQRKLTEEAKVSDTVGGLPVTGSVGKQKELHQAQITGFTRDSEQKVMKIIGDIFSVAKSTDVGILPSDFGFENTAMSSAVTKAINGIGA